MKRLFLATVLFTLAILSGGKAMAQFAGGSGIQNDPYLIATAEQFNKMGENQDSSKYYKQIANLTFGGQNAFKAIEFSGHYDGGGHWITADGRQNTALFGTLSGKVKNVTLFGIDVQTDKSSGILAVSIGGGRLDTISVFASSLSVSANASVLSAGILASSSHTSTIFFCGVDNCSISFNPGTWTGEVGGLVGISHGGCTLEYSSFSGNIDLYGSNSNRYASGLIGRADGGTVRACMVSDGYVNVAENAYTDTGNINANICGLVYSAGNTHTAIRNSAIESNFALKLMGNPVHNNNPNVNEISNSTDISKCATVFSDVNPENITQMVVYLNDGLNPPAFTVSNGQIVHATTSEMYFTNGRYESIGSGRFDYPTTWQRTGDATPPEYIINQYHKVSIEQGVTLPANINIMVKYAGSLINKTDNAVTASMEGALYHGWNCMGFPVHGKSAIAPLAADGAPDIWALAFDYTNNKWNENNFLHYNDDQKDSIEAGNGIMAFCNSNYPPITTGLTVNDNLIVTNPVTGTDNDGRWMALANPYPATITTADIKAQTQGQTIYVYITVGIAGTWQAIDKLHSGTGFMVNMPERQNSIVFRKNMIDGYGTTTGTKSTPAERDFLTVSVSTDGYKVPVMFAKNEAAREDYDIFDANKLFGDGSLAEPYLICNDINLCKEEVNTLPYTATMNIKSGEARSVEIIADNIPEGYSLVLLDGEEEIAMNQGDVYTVNIASGENADRFKLKIGEKNVSITEIEAAEELNIRNNNRNIIIEGGKNVKAEVYNTLGQKVYETTKRNFTLEGIEAGAYVVKVQSGNAVQSHKMIIR